MCAEPRVSENQGSVACLSVGWLPDREREKQVEFYGLFVGATCHLLQKFVILWEVWSGEWLNHYPESDQYKSVRCLSQLILQVSGSESWQLALFILPTNIPTVTDRLCFFGGTGQASMKCYRIPLTHFLYGQAFAGQPLQFQKWLGRWSMAVAVSSPMLPYMVIHSDTFTQKVRHQVSH